MQQLYGRLFRCFLLMECSMKKSQIIKIIVCFLPLLLLFLPAPAGMNESLGALPLLRGRDSRNHAASVF